MAIVQYKNFAYLKGPKGDRGERGPRGERGLRGDKGDKGDRGLQGETLPASAFRGVISGSSPILFDSNTGVISFNSQGFATEDYVDSAIANLVSGAPDLLNTLNEIAAAIGNNANFVDNVVLKTGSTMTGTLTLAGNPANNLDAATKEYVDSSINSIQIILSTDDVAEGSTNLYFTESRARAAISVTGDLVYDAATGVISYTGGTSDFSGDYNDLTNKPVIPYDISQLTDTTGILESGGFGPAQWSDIKFDGGNDFINLQGTEFANSEFILDSGIYSLEYIAGNPNSWSGSAPTTVGEALDRIAALLKTLNNGTGA